MKWSDYESVKHLGKGSFGEVFLVRYNGNLYAIKELDKDFVITHGKTDHVFRERNVL